MLRFILVLACVSPAAALPTAAGIARQIQEAGLDRGECYRVIEQTLSRGDLRVYLTSGYLIFTRAVNGMRTGAVFTTEVEGGDGEILLLPPLRSERLSLVNFTGSPNLNEHFHSALMLFTDGTADELLTNLRTSGAKKVPEMGIQLAERWNSTTQNIGSSFQVRLVEDVLGAGSRGGFFFITASGNKLGNFDVLYDPKIQENTLVGQVGDRNGRSFFNVWTSFTSRSKRAAEATPPAISLENFRIDATIAPDLMLKAVTRVTVTAKEASRAVAFVISPNMRVLDAKVDGQPAEVFQHESLRSTLISGSDDQEFLVVTPGELEPDKPHEFEIRHEGAVISNASNAGDQVYYVASRATWYPRRSFEFARYDLTFHYPKQLDFVATGDLVEDRIEGDSRTARRSTTVPIRFASFNLGDYKSITIAHDPYRIEVFANRKLENALKPRPSAPLKLPDQSWVRRRSSSSLEHVNPAPEPNPSSGLEALARDVAGAFDFMVAQFGPPPIKTLYVSPIPGSFGQGFPGLLYLSTVAYLDPAQRPLAARARIQETFFSDMLDAHEVAHQWWGNLVTTSDYQDAWLMEALANYSALLYLEKKKGPHAVDTILDDFRDHLLEKCPTGRSWESSGPITWGYRLESSQAPDAWHRIIYEKGAWVLHMLRRKMGDDRFLAMLKTMCQRYQFRAISTDQFRRLAAEFAPPQMHDPDLSNFFDTWVYGIGIPAVKISYEVHGSKITGTAVQSEVPDDFTAQVPIEVQAGRQRTLYWVATSSDPIPFSIQLKAPAAKVALSVKDVLVVVKK